jgi:hypothetical protein
VDKAPGDRLAGDIGSQGGNPIDDSTGLDQPIIASLVTVAQLEKPLFSPRSE